MRMIPWGPCILIFNIRILDSQTPHYFGNAVCVCPCLLAGLPPRRIWLELRKLNAAEVQQPGAFAQALKLAYHLGLLRHILPFCQVGGPEPYEPPHSPMSVSP